MLDRPGHLSLQKALSALDGKVVLVATDFDGTLAPIVADPSAARPHPGVVPALLTLARRSDVTVAVVSGRRRAELAALLGVTGPLVIIGEHGADTGGDVGTPSELIGPLAGRVRSIAADYPGTMVEEKRFSVAFHYRNAAKPVAAALSSLKELTELFPGVVMSQGKKVAELHLSPTTKGDAVEALRASAGVEAVIFIGDDVTDESVFLQLRPPDVGVKVGVGESAAGYRVPGVEEVVELLEQLASRG